MNRTDELALNQLEAILDRHESMMKSLGANVTDEMRDGREELLAKIDLLLTGISRRNNTVNLRI